MRGDLRVVDDPAAEAAERIAAAAGGHIVLSGGSTPKLAYEWAAGKDVDWSQTTFWFGDDRCVPPDHEHSNYRMFKESFLERLSGGAPDVHRIHGEKGPNAGAEDYERELREVLGEQIPRVDLALMGLGPDAHTASLFPNQEALNETARAAVGVREPGMAPHVPRVTLTLPVLNAARSMLWLISGQDKAGAVARAFDHAPSPDAPASLVDPAGGMTILLDSAAAEQVT